MQDFIDLVNQEVPQDDSAEVGEKLFLYGLIRALKPKVVVETGTHKGKTTLFLAQAVKENGDGMVATYDPFDWGAPGNFRKFPELEKVITYYKEPGKDVHESNIDLAFIDGYHETEIVLEEIQAFLPRLSENGVMVFHDCHYERPQAENVNLACEQAGLKTVWLPTANALRIYCKAHNEN